MTPCAVSAMFTPTALWAGASTRRPRRVKNACVMASLTHMEHKGGTTLVSEQHLAIAIASSSFCERVVVCGRLSEDASETVQGLRRGLAGLRSSHVDRILTSPHENEVVTAMGRLCEGACLRCDNCKRRRARSRRSRDKRHRADVRRASDSVRYHRNPFICSVFITLSAGAVLWSSGFLHDAAAARVYLAPLYFGGICVDDYDATVQGGATVHGAAANIQLATLLIDERTCKVSVRNE
jgi:hypothetical protein